jgi:hypothetical protein
MARDDAQVVLLSAGVVTIQLPAATAQLRDAIARAQRRWRGKTS